MELLKTETAKWIKNNLHVKLPNNKNL
jgi:hypothetical protein